MVNNLLDLQIHQRVLKSLETDILKLFFIIIEKKKKQKRVSSNIDGVKSLSVEVRNGSVKKKILWSTDSCFKMSVFEYFDNESQLVLCF